MAQEKFAVQLSVEDRSELERLIRSGRSSARVINRARILLKTDEGWSASQVAVGAGHVAAHGVSHQAAVRRGGIGRRTPRPSPGQPVPQAG